jgi:hypothetical protein
MAADPRPSAPILEGDLREPKTFYHNAAYKTNRVAINLEKMKVRVCFVSLTCGWGAVQLCVKAAAERCSACAQTAAWCKRSAAQRNKKKKQPSSSQNHHNHPPFSPPPTNRS